jgi:hypothetical protein
LAIKRRRRLAELGSGEQRALEEQLELDIRPILGTR